MKLLRQKLYSTEDDLVPLVAAGGVASTICLAAKKKKLRLRRGGGYGHIKASIKNDKSIKYKFDR